MHKIIHTLLSILTSKNISLQWLNLVLGLFFPCIHVSGSMCNECMLVGWLVGRTDGWMVGYTFQCSECCMVYMESVCSSGQYIYTRTYYIVANAFAIFVYISKSMITLCRPGPGQQKSTITIIVIIDSQFLLFFG